MAVEIREAAPEDYDGLIEVLAEIDAYHAEHLPHVFRPTCGPARSRAYVLSLLEDPDSVLLVAEEGGRVVGVADVRAHTTPDIPVLVPRRYAMVDAIVVRRTHQGRGIGRELMRCAESWARASGLEEVRLNVWEFNQGAIAFYEKLGYTTTLRRMARCLDDADG